MPSTSGTTTVITRTSMFVAVSTPSTPSQGLTFRDTTLVTTIKPTIAECVSETLVNVIRLENITSKLISVSWTGINLDQQIQYKVKLESGSNSSQSETSATKAVFSDLTPGTMYTLIIEYLSCSIKKYISANIITAGKVYESFTRIPGRDFVSDYTNQSSKLYKDFVTNFNMQVENNLPKEYQDLIRDKEMVIVVTGVRRGSVIVDFDLVTALEVNLLTSDVQNSVINALKSSALGVDLNITSVKEADICQRGSYTCSKNASCVREGPSHTCECKAGFYDENPTVPGTDCKRVSQISTAPGEGWKVATIVLGVLLGLILLVGVVVLISTAVRKATSKLTSYNLQHTEHNRQVVSNDYLQGCYSYQIKNIKILKINNI
ncbi:uromodulin-like 1 [Oncorhynchus clarkii lewisi]|uniref:uromodulin-like 1 n=1 Tax=Oncorhynchus clarkii lewisi TaxID=490388 RepID=UPI0039B920CC